MGVSENIITEMIEPGFLYSILFFAFEPFYFPYMSRRNSLVKQCIRIAVACEGDYRDYAWSPREMLRSLHTSLLSSESEELNLSSAKIGLPMASMLAEGMLHKVSPHHSFLSRLDRSSFP